MTCSPARACSRVSGSRFAEPAGTKFQQSGSHRPLIAIASPAKASSRCTDDLNRIGLGRARGGSTVLRRLGTKGLEPKRDLPKVSMRKTISNVAREAGRRGTPRQTYVRDSVPLGK